MMGIIYDKVRLNERKIEREKKWGKVRKDNGNETSRLRKRNDINERNDLS